MWDKINRLKEGLASETSPDLLKSTKAIVQGMTFFYLSIHSKIAKLRYERYCESCKYNVEDPVESMHENDKDIPELSGRMCSHCGGCVLSFKLRQDVKKCEYWNE